MFPSLSLPLYHADFAGLQEASKRGAASAAAVAARVAFDKSLEFEFDVSSAHGSGDMKQAKKEALLKAEDEAERGGIPRRDVKVHLHVVV